MRTNLTIYLLISVSLFYGCKKTSTTVSKDTFFKIYDVSIGASSSASYTTIVSSGANTNDINGNIYTWYVDTIINPNRFAILKTDKYGKKIWNKSYFKFSPACNLFSAVNDNFLWQDFLCLDQNLLLAGTDSLNNNVIIKINSISGNIESFISLGSIIPSGLSLFKIISITLTKENNILLNGSCLYTDGYAKPLLALLDATGNVIWSKTNFNFPIINTNNDFENGTNAMQLSNGNYIFGTVGRHYRDTTNSNFIYKYTLNVYHLDKLGNIIQYDTVDGGSTINIDNANPVFYSCTSYTETFYAFQVNETEEIIVASEYYDQNNFNLRTRIFKLGSSSTVQNTSFINLGNCVISNYIQKPNGDVLLSCFYQQYPVSNLLCNLYKIDNNINVTQVKEIGLSSQSIFISGMSATTDGHTILSGLIQSYGKDTNNLFILKINNNEYL